jgi:quercetin dioxygenase-like cupin family protein
MSAVMPRFTRRVALSLLAAPFLAPSLRLARAQDEEVASDTLLKVDLEAKALPAPPAFMRLVRITLEPGATSPEHTHPGPEFGRIESGVVTITVKGPARIKQRSAKESDPFDEAEQNKENQLDRGDQIYYPAGTPMTFTNKGKEKASILALVVLPATNDHPPLIDYTAATPTADTFEGVTSQILGDAILTTAPSGPATVTINDVALKPAQSLPGSRNPVLYSVVKGDCSFKVTGGSVQISRTEKPGPQNDTELNKDIELKLGDAMFFPNGLRTTSRGENSGSLELLQVLVEPASSDEKLSEENRGQLKFNQPSSPPEETPSSSGTAGNWRDGDSVYVNSSDVNLRDSPSTNGGQVTVLIYGQELIIDGDPTDADGFTWWPVHIADNPDISGYVVQDFIQSDPVQ